MKFQIKMLIVGTILLGLVLTSRAQTYQVYPVKFVLSGAIQFVPADNVYTNFGGITTNLIVNPQPVHPVVIKGEDLVNLARGRNLGTPLPNNEVLALASVCGTNLSKIVVFDTVASSNLATIAELNAIYEAVGYKGHGATNKTVNITTNLESAIQVTIPGAGNSTNALTGGLLMLDAQSQLTTNGCVHRWSGTMMGVLATIVTDSGVSSNYTVIVRKATLSTSGKEVGSFSEAD